MRQQGAGGDISQYHFLFAVPVDRQKILYTLAGHSFQKPYSRSNSYHIAFKNRIPCLGYFFAPFHLRAIWEQRLQHQKIFGFTLLGFSQNVANCAAPIAFVHVGTAAYRVMSLL